MLICMRSDLYPTRCASLTTDEPFAMRRGISQMKIRVRELMQGEQKGGEGGIRTRAPGVAQPSDFESAPL